MKKIKFDIVIPNIPVEVDWKELQTIISKYPDNYKVSVELYKILMNKLNYIIESDNTYVEEQEPYVTCIIDEEGNILYEY